MAAPRGVLWLDLSNHQGVFTPRAAADAWVKGYRGVVVNLYGPYALQQATVARAAGFRLAAYVYLNMPGGKYYTEGLSPADQIRGFMPKVQAGLVFERLWIDCEDERNTLSPVATVDVLREARAAVVEGGLRPGWYTGPWWWSGMTDNCAEFIGDPLWIATNDKVPDLSLASWPDCPWPEAAMEQHDWNELIDSDLPEVDADVMREGFDVAREGAELNVRSLNDVQKVALGSALEPIMRQHFSDLVNTTREDGYDVTLADDPSFDVVVFIMPKGTLPQV